MTFFTKGNTMATVKQATGAILDSIVMTTVATGAVTKQVAGTLVVGTGVLNKSVKYADELINRELEELKLANESELKYLADIYADEKTQALIKSKMTKSILAKYEPEQSTSFDF